MTQNTEQNVRTREDREQEIAIMLCKARGRDPFQMTYQTIEPGVMEPYGDAWCHYLPEAKAVLEWQEAEARGAEEQRRKDAVGYLFDNPDTGTEYLPYHPIESGECQDAENIREATSTELLSALIASWQGWKEDRDEKEKISSTVAALGRDLNDWRSRFWKADNERVRYRECMTDCVALLNRIKSGGLTRIWLKNCLEESPQDTGEE